ncbi:TRAP transporter substrate-binding protein DctP [Alcaligenaceae bacterium]|nr:TRAP transporter substrate-binding protein DctP [Alcaligenaceae bacterium]
MYKKLTALLIATSFCASAAMAADTQKLTIQTIYQTGDVNHRAIERFAANVKSASAGRLEIDLRTIGSVVGYTETVDAVAAGVLDGHIAFPGYFSGTEPGLGAIADLPSGYDNPYQAQMMMEYGGGLELLREMYATLGMYTVGALWSGVESMPVAKEVMKVDDLKGVKIRAPQGMASILFEKVGASVVNLPGSEVYGAFEKGVIDATDWGTLAMNEDAGLHGVATGFIHPGIHSMPLIDFSISLDRWKKLSPDLQTILTMATRDLSRDMIQSNAVRDAKTLQSLAAKSVPQYDWPVEERQAFRKTASEVWASYAEKSDYAKKAIDLQISFLKEQGYMQ